MVSSTGNPSPAPLAGWPDSNDATDLLAIVQEQTGTIADQATMIDRYQGILNAAQGVVPSADLATALATASGTPATTLTVSSVAGTITIGATVSGAGIPAGTTIMAQQSGTTGSNGVYTTSQPTTANGTTVAFTPPPSVTVATATGTATGTSLAVTNVNGSIVIGATVSGAGVPAGVTVVNQMSGTAGAAGTYTTSAATTATAAPLAFAPPPPSNATMAWPTPRDAPTLTLVMQNQTAVIRTQTALIQHYQDVLNSSQTPIS
jgi:hypothetical protein